MTRTSVLEASAGWEAALEEIEHQAQHWDTPDHGQTGHLIAMALLAAVEIARSGGLQCEHRQARRSRRRKAVRRSCGSPAAERVLQCV